jgi:arylsulfatase A-like enzyme
MEKENGKREWLLHPAPLKVQLLLTVLAVYLHTFSEWLFFVTKPSFMLQSGTAERLRILLLSPLPLILAGAALVLLWHAEAIFARNELWRRRLKATGIVVPAAVLACTAFLLIDNFTYTVFRRGVITAGPLSLWIYRLLFPALVLVSTWFMGKKGSLPARSSSFPRLAVLARSLLVISLVAALFRPGAFSPGPRKDEIGRAEDGRRPNILLLVGDGMNASHMSLYGYFRQTTPFLDSLAPEALLCENSFTNAGNSGASITSMLTSRMPSRLRLICPPDILRGADSYRHLPGILKGLGYRTFDISVRHHADPYDLNMRNAFDWANHRRIEEGFLSGTLSRQLGQEPDYFMHVMAERISERLLHVYGIRRMVDSYAEVVIEARKISRESDDDLRRVNAFFSFIDESPAPFFAHLHLLGTHGPKFYPRRRVFSRRQEQAGEWMTDFYDDAVMSYDQLVREVVEELEERGLRENTLLVILTDHGRQWSIDNRLPLMFHFPGGEHSGRIRENTQILDIAPTILDYMGIDPPGWMEGSSLLAGGPESGRHLFTVRRKSGDAKKRESDGKWILDPRVTGPPFYTLGALGVFYRQNLYKLDLTESLLRISTIEGHTHPASPEEMPDPESIGQILVDHLASCGYDVSTLIRPFRTELIEPQKKEAKPAAAPARRKRIPLKKRDDRKIERRRLR